jgi:hypothetical protein
MRDRIDPLAEHVLIDVIMRDGILFVCISWTILYLSAISARCWSRIGLRAVGRRLPITEECSVAGKIRAVGWLSQCSAGEESKQGDRPADSEVRHREIGIMVVKKAITGGWRFAGYELCRKMRPQ